MLAFVPLAVLAVVLLLPRDKAETIPIRESVLNFWTGLNTGSVLWIIVFYFLFHFQPAMGALWTNYQIETLYFTQTQIGFTDGASYIGLFVGVIIFAIYGIRWQDSLGMRKLFRIFILGSVAMNLTQYLMVEPYFTKITTSVHQIIPFVPMEKVRLIYLACYNFMLAAFLGVVRMSTLSLVGAVIPVKAAGSLFAGFMSVANLSYSFCYSSGAWLWDNGLNYGIFRFLQQTIFGIPAVQGTHMSINLLIFLGSMAYLLSFLAVHMLPDKQQTLATGDDPETQEGPERYNVLGKKLLKNVNIGYVIAMAGLFGAVYKMMGLDIISSILLAFFSTTFFRKLVLDFSLKRNQNKS